MLVLTGMLTIFLNLQTMRHDQGTELTTSAAMLVTCAVGILCGQGIGLTPAAVMVITTALLAWKESLAGFTMGLSDRSCARRWCWRSWRSSSTRRCRKDRSAREA